MLIARPSPRVQALYDLGLLPLLAAFLAAPSTSMGGFKDSGILNGTYDIIHGVAEQLII